MPSSLAARANFTIIDVFPCPGGPSNAVMPLRDAKGTPSLNIKSSSKARAKDNIGVLAGGNVSKAVSKRSVTSTDAACQRNAVTISSSCATGIGP